MNCSNKEDLKIGKETAKFLYDKAMSEANKKEYENANEIFETILTDHPIQYGHKVKTYDSLGIL